MAITEWSDPALAGSYTLDEDHYEQLPDGRVLLVGLKGQAISLREAVRLGLAKPPKAPAAPAPDTRNLEPDKPVVVKGDPPVNTDPAPPAPYGAERAPAAAPASDAPAENAPLEKK